MVLAAIKSAAAQTRFWSFAESLLWLLLCSQASFLNAEIRFVVNVARNAQPSSLELMTFWVWFSSSSYLSFSLQQRILHLDVLTQPNTSSLVLTEPALPAQFSYCLDPFAPVSVLSLNAAAMTLTVLEEHKPHPPKYAKSIERYVDVAFLFYGGNPFDWLFILFLTNFSLIEISFNSLKRTLLTGESLHSNLSNTSLILHHFVFKVPPMNLICLYVSHWGT